MKISPAASDLLNLLRKAASRSNYMTTREGVKFAEVYLDNARPAGMSDWTFAGLLSALTKAGEYRPQDGFAFGDVRVEP